MIARWLGHRRRRRNDAWRLKHWADPLEYRLHHRWVLRLDQRVAVFGPSAPVLR